MIVKDRERYLWELNQQMKKGVTSTLYPTVSTFDFKISLRNKTLKQSSTIMTHQLVEEFGTKCRLLSVAIFESEFLSKLTTKFNAKNKNPSPN